MNVEFKNFSYTYPGATMHSLKNVSLHIKSGECCAFIGKNGSGKSSLGFSIMGINPDKWNGKFSGKVLVNNKNPSISDVFTPDSPLGLIQENPRAIFVGKPIVYEEIAVGPENQGMSKETMLQLIVQSGRRFGITHILDQNIRNISGGEEQRVALSCNWVIKPALWILDEPCTHLDPAGVNDLFDFILELKTTGATVVIFDNRNFDHIAKVADRVFILHRGEIVMDGLPQMVLSSGILDDYSIGTSIYTEVSKKCVELGICKPTHNIPVTFDQAVRFFERISYTS